MLRAHLTVTFIIRILSLYIQRTSLEFYQEKAIVKLFQKNNSL